MKVPRLPRIKIGLGLHANHPESFVELNGERLAGVMGVNVSVRAGEITKVTLDLDLRVENVEIEGLPGELEINDTKAENTYREIISHFMGTYEITQILNKNFKLVIPDAKVFNRYDDVFIDKPAVYYGTSHNAVIQAAFRDLMLAERIVVPFGVLQWDELAGTFKWLERGSDEKTP